jgi:hypothetical protein
MAALVDMAMDAASSAGADLWEGTPSSAAVDSRLDGDTARRLNLLFFQWAAL